MLSEMLVLARAKKEEICFDTDEEPGEFCTHLHLFPLLSLHVVFIFKKWKKDETTIFFFQYGKGKDLSLLAPWNLWHHLRRGFLRAKQTLGQRVSQDATPALTHAPVPTPTRRAIP